MTEEIIANLITDYFDEEYGSKVWPSSDPKDSPCNKFICKQCGWSFHAQIFGGFSLGLDGQTPDPYRTVRKTMREHLSVRHQIGLYGDW